MKRRHYAARPPSYEVKHHKIAIAPDLYHSLARVARKLGLNVQTLLHLVAQGYLNRRQAAPESTEVDAAMLAPLPPDDDEA